MYSIAISAAAGLCLSIVFTRICRDIFVRFNIVDRPDRIRKLHQQPVPRIGGVAIGASYLGAFALLILFPLKGASLVRSHLDLVLCVLLPTLVVFGTGLIDDIRGLTPRWKLLGQIIAAGCAWGAGVQVGAVAGHGIDHVFSLPVTLLWLVACTNAFNLIDGLDGLAAGIGLFATVTTLCAALLNGNMALALATAPLAGALLGFLRYNFNPASIFLGDCGSLSVGFLLGCYAVMWGQKSATLLSMTAPVIVLAVPILDVALSIVRRFLRRKAIFAADRGHIHHRLLDRGLTPRRAVLLVYCFCAFAAAVSLVHSTFHNRYSVLFVLLFCVATFFAVTKLRYTEFRVAGKLLFRGTLRQRLSSLANGSFRDQVSAELSLINLQQALLAEEAPRRAARPLALPEVSDSFAPVRTDEPCS